MRNMLLIISLIFTTAFAQSNQFKVKCDSLYYTKDSTHIVAFKKKKAFILDKIAQKPIYKPIKSPFFYLNEVDVFVLFDKTSVQFMHFPKTGNKVIFSVENGEELNIEFADPLSQLDSLIYFNGKYFNYKSGELITDKTLTNSCCFNTTLQVVNYPSGLVAVNYTKQPSELEKNKAEGGFSKSGIYDTTVKRWIIAQNYCACNALDATLICAKKDDTFFHEKDSLKGSFSYDQFTYQNGKLNTVKTGVTSPNEFDLKQLFDADSIGVIGANNFRFVKGHNQTLVALNLVDSLTGKPTLTIEKITVPNSDLVCWNTEYNEIIAYPTNLSDTIFNYRYVSIEKDFILSKKIKKDHNGFVLVGRFNAVEAEEKTLFLTPLHEFIAPNKSSANWSPNDFPVSFGIKKINDSLLIVYDQHENIMSDLLLVNDEGDYLLLYDDETGEENLVYEEIIHGYQRSGIYNSVAKNWMVAPTYAHIYEYPNGFLLSKRVKQDGLEEYTYDFIDRLGQLQFENYTSPKIQTETAIKLFYDADTLFPAAGFFTHGKSQEINRYYVRCHQKYYIHQVNDFAHPPHKAYDFVHEEKGFKTYLENDSIYLKVADTLLAVNQRYGMVALKLIQRNDNPFFEIILQQQQNNYTTYFFEAPMYNLPEETMHFSIQLVNDKLIVKSEYEHLDLDNFLLANSAYEIGPSWADFEAESSAIWEKKNGHWEKQTPYYATVSSLPFGYLVSTGLYSVFDEETYEKITEDKRYIVLDKNYKPISFYDYYDFEDGHINNGVYLKTDKGYFFVSNQGKIITTDKWDDFYFENGRLKGLIYGRATDGSILLDEVIEEESFDF